MAEWLIKLVGDTCDLDALVKVFTEAGCRVTKDDGAYYFASTAFAPMQEPGEVHKEMSERLLPVINGLMKVRNLGYQPVTLDSIVRLNPNGSRTHARFVVASAILSGNARLAAEGTVIGPDGTDVPSREPAIVQAGFQLAQQHPVVADALTYWARCARGDANFWINASKVVDIICDDVGGGNKGQGTRLIVAKQWTTLDELHDFGGAANNPAVSGDKARHGARRRQRPTALSEGEAVAFVQRLLNSWLDEKAKQTRISVP